MNLKTDIELSWRQCFVECKIKTWQQCVVFFSSLLNGAYCASGDVLTEFLNIIRIN
jgi:hypothetical protein